MKDLPAKFLMTSAVFGLCGMIWGIQMSATHDHSLSPAHGHLNLIGFVSLAIFGFYYALTPRAASSRLASIHLGLSVLTVLVLVPGIAMAISGAGETLAKIGSGLALFTLGLFLFVILRNGVGHTDGEIVKKQAAPR